MPILSAFMYGKHFESMYEGSMYGAGLAVFAVWGYVISHARDGRLELQPRKLADTLGGEVDEINSAITFLMQPDPTSRNKDCDGRRLIKEGEFQYSVPSWECYYKIKNEDDRREYNRVMKRRERARKKATKSNPTTMAQRAIEQARKNGDDFEAERGEHIDEGQSPTLAEHLGGPNT